MQGKNKKENKNARKNGRKKSKKMGLTDTCNTMVRSAIRVGLQNKDRGSCSAFIHLCMAFQVDAASAHKMLCDFSAKRSKTSK